MACVPSHKQWLAIRCSSHITVRRYRARRGTSIDIIFSTVWYWNETYLTVIFLEGGIQSLPMQLAKFTQAYENLYPPGVVNIFDRLNEAVKLSGTFLNILPLLLMYFALQKWFVESIERTGLTGE